VKRKPRSATKRAYYSAGLLGISKYMATLAETPARRRDPEGPAPEGIGKGMVQMTNLMHWLLLLAAGLLALVAVVVVLQRKLLFYPGHGAAANGLLAWSVDGSFAGYSRQVANPKNVWLFTHGNAGQAADRTYALPSFSPADAVYILEYPGYGNRPGAPGKASIDAAALQAYRWLRKHYPHTPVCAAGESIGSGTASTLASQEPPPDKIVLVVPFDNLAGVVRDHLPLVPSFLLADRWDNVAALKGYSGKVEIFGALEDEVIPVRHARNLAKSLPGAVLHLIPGGHNDWSASGMVQIRNN
jgi:uncharacterized protein